MGLTVQAAYDMMLRNRGMFEPLEPWIVQNW